MTKVNRKLSLLLIFSIIIGLLPYNIKAESYNVKAESSSDLSNYVIHEDAEVRVSRTEDERNYYESTFNKVTRKVDVKIISKATNKEVDVSHAYEETPEINYSEEEIQRAREKFNRKDSSLGKALIASNIVSEQNTLRNAHTLLVQCSRAYRLYHSV